MKEYRGEIKDCIVIGGGQAGLSCGYYLRRTKLNYLILDDREEPGGAWLSTWDSLKIFSPPEQSSLPGYIMPKDKEDYPRKNHVIKYLSDYEKRYNLNILRNTKIVSVDCEDGIFYIKSEDGEMFRSKTLIAATGTWAKPNFPDFRGLEIFKGEKIHSAQYLRPQKYRDKNVMLIGAGNSAAQIYADLYDFANIYWVTLEAPTFLPEHVDGRYLFNSATERYKEYVKNGKRNSENDLGNIVQVESVRKLYSQKKMQYYRMFDHFDKNGAIWEDGSKVNLDAVIACTGFKSAIDYLGNLNIIKSGRIKTNETRVKDFDGLWLVGFGNWTGYASATLIGVGRTAKKTIAEIAGFLK